MSHIPTVDIHDNTIEDKSRNLEIKNGMFKIRNKSTENNTSKLTRLKNNSNDLK